MATQVSLNDGAVASAGALAIQTNGTTQAVSISTGQVATLAQNPVLTSGTANGVAYLNGSKVLTTGSALTYNGSVLGITNAGDGGGKVTNSSTTGSGTWNLTNNSGSIVQLMLYGSAQGAYGAIGSGEASIYSTVSTTLMADNASGVIKFATGGNAEKMRLDSGGKLLLGVTSGTGLSGGDFAMGNGKSIRFRNAADSAYISAFEFTSANGLNIGTGGSLSTITFGISGIGEAGRFDTSGNLLVGVTSGTSYKLALKTSAASQSAIGTTGTSGDTAFQAILITKFDNDSTTSQNFIQFQINNGGANCGKITANGANTAAFGSTSDQRVKENIAELPSQLDNIMALRPVEFDYLESYGGGHQIGFIAQEMQQIYPDVISTDDSSEKIMSITGWSKTEARLVKAIQEQQAIIQSLTARITALEGA